MSTHRVYGISAAWFCPVRLFEAKTPEFPVSKVSAYSRALADREPTSKAPAVIALAMVLAVVSL